MKYADIHQQILTSKTYTATGIFVCLFVSGCVLRMSGKDRSYRNLGYFSVLE